jgi:hypothetical protein
MTINRFRIAASFLIGFNILGTLLTWAAHLQKPGTGAANAVASGTLFTGPLILVAIGAIALALTFSARRALVRVGAVLLVLYGAGFAFGEVTELFQRNVGIGPVRWDIVLAGSVIGVVIGLSCAALGVLALVAQRRALGKAEQPASTRADVA